MPYLFDSEEVYKSVMEDSDYMENVYESTDEAGFRVVTWYNAGTRNFYAKTPINTPDDLKGKRSVYSRVLPALPWQMLLVQQQLPWLWRGLYSHSAGRDRWSREQRAGADQQ